MQNEDQRSREHKPKSGPRSGNWTNVFVSIYYEHSCHEYETCNIHCNCKIILQDISIIFIVINQIGIQLGGYARQCY